MADVVMLEAALFQLRAAAEDVDATFAPELDLCMSVLANAVASARDGVNAARVNDIEFAVRDLVAAIDELPVADAERLAPLLQMIRDDVSSLKEATSLDPSIIASLRALQAKLRERMSTLEQQTYVEGGSSAPLPHPPGALRDEALPLQQHLASVGFSTPALDGLIADPSSLRFYSMSDIINELDAIAG